MQYMNIRSKFTNPRNIIGKISDIKNRFITQEVPCPIVRLEIVEPQ